MLSRVTWRVAAFFRSPQAADEHLTTPALLAYALTVWPLTTAQLSLPFVAPYYAGSYGLSLAFAGIVLTVGRLLDVAADVGVAWSSDRTRSRFGRRKPWVVAGLLLYIPATLCLFVPPASVSPTRYVASVLFFFLAWTTAFIPYLSQGTELSDDYAVKSRINITQSAVMLFSLLSALTLPMVLVDPKAAFLREALADRFGGWFPQALAAYLHSPAATGSEYFRRSMLVISALSLAPLLIALPAYVLKVHERAVSPVGSRGSMTAALRNPVFLRFALGYVFLMAGYMGRLGLMPILLSYALELPNTYLFFMLLMYGTALIITPVWARLLSRFERATCVVAAALVEAVGLTILCFTPGHHTAVAAIAFMIMGLPGQTLLMVPYLMAADASDYARWKTGFDSRAIHVSLCSVITKLGSVVAGLTVWLAGVAGLDPARGEQPAQVVGFLKLIGLGLPITCLALGSLIVLRFPLDRRRHAAVCSRLARRDALVRA